MTSGVSTLLVIPCICVPNLFYFMVCRNIRLLSFQISTFFCIMLRFISMVVAGLWLKFNIFDIYGLLPTTDVGWIGIPCIIYGQVLNISVFATLGLKGVYYGKEFGVLKNVKYHTGFPFSMISQPQYSGAILTICGCMTVWGIKPDYTINYDLLTLSTVGVCSYMFSIKVENKYAVPQNYKIY
jgi:hypothetical protein